MHHVHQASEAIFTECQMLVGDIIEVLRLTSRPGSQPFLLLWGASATELSKLAL